MNGAERQAGQRLAAIVAALDGKDADARLDVRAQLEQAHALLADGIEDQRYGSASLACEKALAVVAYEEDRKVMIEAPEEEAVRRGEQPLLASEAMTERGDDAEGDWRFQPSRAMRETFEADQDRGVERDFSQER